MFSISFWSQSTEPSFQNESCDSVSCKPLDGFKNAFNIQKDFFYLMVDLLLPFYEIPKSIAQFLTDFFKVLEN